MINLCIHGNNLLKERIIVLDIGYGTNFRLMGLSAYVNSLFKDDYNSTQMCDSSVKSLYKYNTITYNIPEPLCKILAEILSLSLIQLQRNSNMLPFFLENFPY